MHLNLLSGNTCYLSTWLRWSTAKNPKGPFTRTICRVYMNWAVVMTALLPVRHTFLLKWQMFSFKTKTNPLLLLCSTRFSLRSIRSFLERRLARYKKCASSTNPTLYSKTSKRKTKTCSANSLNTTRRWTNWPALSKTQKTWSAPTKCFWSITGLCATSSSHKSLEQMPTQLLTGSTSPTTAQFGMLSTATWKSQTLTEFSSQPMSSWKTKRQMMIAVCVALSFTKSSLEWLRPSTSNPRR